MAHKKAKSKPRTRKKTLNPNPKLTQAQQRRKKLSSRPGIRKHPVMEQGTYTDFESLIGPVHARRKK